MKFLCYYQILDGKGPEARKQWTTKEENFFGVEMIARYHSANGQQGVVIVESDSPVNLASWAEQWDSVITIEIHPCNEDDGAMQAIEQAN